jgi:hypothetical protein
LADAYRFWERFAQQGDTEAAAAVVAKATKARKAARAAVA